MTDRADRLKALLFTDYMKDFNELVEIITTFATEKDLSVRELSILIQMASDSIMSDEIALQVEEDLHKFQEEGK